VSDYVSKITEELDGVILDEPIHNNKLRFTVDESADSLSKKIRRAVDYKIPVIIIVGPKDAEEGIVSVRLRDKEEKIKLSELVEFIKSL